MVSRRNKVAWAVVALSLVSVSTFALFASSDPDSTAFKVGAFGDAYVSQASPTAAYGRTTVIWVSKIGDTQNWGLVSFDAASKLRPTDILVSARIRLLVDQTSGTQFPAIMMTGRLLADFNEATVTYNTKPAVSFDLVTNTFFDKRPGPGKTIFVDVTKQLMAWRDGRQGTYFGVVFAMNGDTVSAGIGFASRENPSWDGPVLQIFTVPPGQTPYGYTISPGEIFAIRPST